MKAEFLIIGLVAVVVVTAAYLSYQTYQPQPAFQQPLAQPTVTAEVVDPFADCIDDVLLRAEQCVLAGGTNCKAEADLALDNCKGLPGSSGRR